jgi:hypothetical protein
MKRPSAKRRRASLDAEMSLRDAARRRFLSETGIVATGVVASAWLDATDLRIRVRPITPEKLA